MSNVLTGLANFSCDMYQRLARGSDSMFFSPYSVSSALGLAHAGALGSTAEQMASVLHYGDSNPLDILGELVGLGSKLNTKDGKIKTDVANAAYIEKTLKVRDEYATLLVSIGDLLKRVDYINAHKAVRKEINDWVEEQTNSLIKDLIPDGALDPLTRMVLVNAIYFKAKWTFEFDKDETYKRDFADLGGNKSKADTMIKRKMEPLYMEDDRCQLALLPYGNKMVNMAIFLPNKELGLERFEEGFDFNYYQSALGNVYPQKLGVIALPKFKLESTMELGNPLIEMGMPIPFSRGANFSGMVEDGEDELLISGVIHKAVVEVDEEGTEAAAATAVVMRCLGMPANRNPDFIVDRPFMFAILDLVSQAPLFMGRVTSL